MVVLGLAGCWLDSFVWCDLLGLGVLLILVVGVWCLLVVDTRRFVLFV